MSCLPCGSILAACHGRSAGKPVDVNQSSATRVHHREERIMPMEASSVVLLAEVRHAELQAESARYRVVRQAHSNGSTGASLPASVRRRLVMALNSAGIALRGTGLTNSPQRQEANSV